MKRATTFAMITLLLSAVATRAHAMTATVGNPQQHPLRIAPLSVMELMVRDEE